MKEFNQSRKLLKIYLKQANVLMPPIFIEQDPQMPKWFVPITHYD